MSRTQDVWETGGIDGTYIKTTSVDGYDILINGTDRYLNFNTTVGVNGYGIRDNSGTMQFRNFGGSWTDFGSGGGGTVDGSGTANEIAYWVDSNTLGALAVATYPSLTELSHVKGVTLAIQTQLNAKQTLDATLTALAGLTIAADSLSIGTGADAFSQTTFAANTFPAKASTGNLVAKSITDFGLSLVDDADASTARTTLGLVIGTNVQAYDADLTTWAGITPGANVGTALAVAVGTDGAFVVKGGALGTPSSGVATNITGLPAGSIVPGTLVAGTYLLAENASIGLDPAGSADGKYTGITVTGVSGYSQAFGDLVTLDKDDSRWEAVDISVAAAATGDARGILGMVVVAGTDGNACTILLQGIIRADANFPALTIGAAVFASTTGDIVVTQPVTTDYVIRQVGFALTADEIFFSPTQTWVTHT